MSGTKIVPVEPSAAVLDRAVAYALNVSISGEGGWTAYMRALWGRMLSAVPDFIPTHRHRRRGTVYQVIGEAEVQHAGIYMLEGAALTIYRGEDGKLWARPTAEFNDGRFEPMERLP